MPAPGSLPESADPADEAGTTLRVFAADDRVGLRALLDGFLPPVAAGLALRVGPERGRALLAVVARTDDELSTKVRQGAARIDAGQSEFEDGDGLFLADPTPFAGAKVAFVFPGQGAQAVGMLAELEAQFPEVRRAFDEFDAASGGGLRSLIYPTGPLAADQIDRHREALRITDVAQPALGAACLGMVRLLERFGVRPDVTAGYSYGELPALGTAGVFAPAALAELSRERGRLVIAAAGADPGAMAVLVAGPDAVTALLAGIDGVALVHWNGPTQTVISGTKAGVDAVLARARSGGIAARPLPLACAFHSPLIASAAGPVAALAGRLGPLPPKIPVYSNVNARPYDPDAEAIARQVGEHLIRPVQFAPMIEAMHRDGARVFVEAGPGWIVSSLVRAILAGRPHLVAPCDPPERPGVAGLCLTLGRLAAAGVPLTLPDATPAGRSKPVRALPVTSPPKAALAEFRRVMGEFLDVQRDVMQTLAEVGAPEAPPDRRSRWVAAPLGNRRGRLRAGGVVLMTDDGRGVARAVAAELRSLGYHPEVLRVGRGGPARAEVDLLDLPAAADRLRQARAVAPVAALVHAAALGGRADAFADWLGWGQWMLLAADDLRESARLGGAAVLVASSRPDPGDLPPAGCRNLFGAPLAAAWLAELQPGMAPARVRAVDLDPDEETEVLAAALVQELFAEDDRVAVSYERGERWAFVPPAQQPIASPEPWT